VSHCSAAWAVGLKEVGNKKALLTPEPPSTRGGDDRPTSLERMTGSSPRPETNSGRFLPRIGESTPKSRPPLASSHQRARPDDSGRSPSQKFMEYNHTS